MRQPLRVRFQLDTVHCFDEADGPGDAEPYLWAVYFKIDGDTVFLDERNMLAGTATVSTRPGNHGDLGDTDVGAGDDVAIPPSIGMYDTVLKPIPLTKPFPGIEDVGGVVGCVVVMLEQDNTPDDAIAQGHAALDQAIRRELDQLIPKFGILHQSPTQMEIAEIEQRVQDAVRSAIEDAMSFLAKLLTLGNSDDVIGQSFFSVSHDDLAASGAASIPFRSWST